MLFRSCGSLCWQWTDCTRQHIEDRYYRIECILQKSSYGKKNLLIEKAIIGTQIAVVCVPFYVQPHAEEARRQGGAWNARRVVEKVVPLPDCISVFCPKKLHKKTEKILYDTTVIFSYVHNISTENKE